MKVNEEDSLSLREKKISETILNWSKGKESYLNVIAPPYNTSIIFFQVVSDYVKLGKRVLYITDEEERHIEVLKSFKKGAFFKDFTYLKNNVDSLSSLLVFCSSIKAIQLNDKFDLVIYDDIRSYPEYSKYKIIDILNNCAKENGKLIAYSVEAIFPKRKEITMHIRDNRIPIVEPRVITTRLDINKEMPNAIYEYIKWSIDIDRKVVISVPDNIKLLNITSYIYKCCQQLTTNIFYYSSIEKNRSAIDGFHKYKSSLIVTDDFDRILRKDENINIIVGFADDATFNYKKLVYLCGRTGKGELGDRGEVILLAKDETKDIEKAKKLTRNFNKEAWEKGLLSI